MEKKSEKAEVKKTGSKKTGETKKSVEKKTGAKKPASKKTKPKETTKRKILKFVKRFFIGLALTIGLLIIAVLGLIVGSLAGYVEDVELIDVENMRLNLTSIVYMEDPETGEMVECEQLYDTEHRIWVSSKQIPDHLKDAFVAIEDERFYSHKGIDIKRFTGAAMQYISKKGSSSYGGSTITQQLIKNLTQEDDYSIKRKIQEVYRAFNLERELSKEEILEYYLNTIYLGQKCNGVQSASMKYFGKDVSELSLAECATIAGITQFPTKYDPLINPENNKARQLVILKKMYDLGFISAAEYKQAKNEELVFVKKNPEEEEHYHSYFTDAVIDQIIEDLMEQYNYTKPYASQVLFNGGLKIYLSVDQKMQAHMDAVYSDPNAFQRAAGEVQPQSAMVIMDPYTGLVKALVGGRGEKEGNRTLNRATQTLRQPGSTIKPISTYAPAIEYGLITPDTVINDAPIKFGGWAPRNDDRAFRGRITVATALRGSRNVPAVKICDYLTAEASFNYMKNILHFDTLVEYRKTPERSFTDVGLAPIALGGLTDGVTVLDMCAAYCIFPNGGKYIKPSLYTKVLDSDGKVLLEHKGTKQIALSQTTSESMVSMLKSAVDGGTGTAARIPGMRVAGKTGTTSSNRDRWFVGFTPYYVGAVWFGYDQPASLRGFSPNPAAVAWRKVMQPIHEGLPDKPFFEHLESGKKEVMLCKDSNLRATPACKELVCKKFENGKAPTGRCDKHPYNFNKNQLGGGVIKKEEKVEGFVEEDSGDSGLTSGGIVLPPAGEVLPTPDVPSDVPITGDPSQPPAETPPAEAPPAETPPVETPPAEPVPQAPPAEPTPPPQSSSEGTLDLGL